MSATFVDPATQRPQVVPEVDEKPKVVIEPPPPSFADIAKASNDVRRTAMDN